MPITGKGWELLLVRKAEQRRTSDGKIRTVGTYAVFHDGKKAAGKLLAGMTAETKGPGANKPAGNGKRIEAGRYPLATQAGAKYVTLNYSQSLSSKVYPKPGIEVTKTGERAEILIHPGIGFVASIGCINPCTSLPNAAETIDYLGSRARVIAIIEDLKTYAGAKWPKHNGLPIPNAFVVIDGEPSLAKG